MRLCMLTRILSPKDEDEDEDEVEDEVEDEGADAASGTLTLPVRFGFVFGLAPSDANVGTAAAKLCEGATRPCLVPRCQTRPPTC